MKKIYLFCDTIDKMKFWCVLKKKKKKIVDQEYACTLFSQNNTYVTSLQKLTVDQILIVY